MATSTGTKILKRLTIRDFIGSKMALLAYAQRGIKKEGDKLGEAVPIMRVIGQVTGYRVGESRDGGSSWVECRGTFQATNLQTGEMQKSVAKMILPNVVSEPLAAALMGGADTADFAVEIDVVFDETTATMYYFEARTLMEVETAKPVAGILARLEAAGVKMTEPLKLAAPKLSAADTAKQAAASAAADAAKAAALKAKEKAKA